MKNREIENPSQKIVKVKNQKPKKWTVEGLNNGTEYLKFLIVKQNSKNQNSKSGRTQISNIENRKLEKSKNQKTK